jgi:hypothetical protein
VLLVVASGTFAEACANSSMASRKRFNTLKKGRSMGFKYAVGQAVEYKPISAGIALFVVVRQMPEEFQAADRRYCIKNAQEGFERNVMECDLSPSTVPPEQYDPPMRLRRSGGHH